jgi:hypothetical protein
MLKNIKPTVDEAHSALIAYQHHPKIRYAGLFVSALYNLVQDKIIVFDVDLDVDINYLGYKLDWEKVLVNRSKVGNLMGYDASGVVVNYGKCGDFMGDRASGVVVNYGEVGDWMGLWASGVVVNYGKCGDFMGDRASGVVVNYGEVGDWMGLWASGVVVNYGKAGCKMGNKSSGKIIAINNPESFGNLIATKLVLKEEECRRIPGLIEYFDKLKIDIEKCRNDERLISEMFSPHGIYRIEKDIDRFLKYVPLYKKILCNLKRIVVV